MGVDDEGGPPTRAVPAVDLMAGRKDPADPKWRRRSATRAVDDARSAAEARAGAPSAGAAPAVVADRLPLRHRVLPRTLLGLTAFILAFAIGAGLSGVVLYSYYQYKLNQTDDRVNALVNGYKTQFANAEGALRADAAAAKAQIGQAVAPIQALEASPQTLAKLTRQLAPSVFFVHTLDQAGQASVGTAFVISSSPSQSLLLTSYATVAAATRSPGPQVYAQRGADSTQVTVRSWDQTYDLALLVLPRGGLTPVQVAPSNPAPTVGERVYAVSGQGSDGAALSQGLLTDVSASGVQHDAALGQSYQGGPLVDSNGQVVAVGSRSYAPLGFTTDSVWYGPYVQAACGKVLTCPGGSLPTS